MTNVSDRYPHLSPLKQALVALDEMQAKLEAVERARTEPLAIIGMGCRFPGGAVNPEAFWQLLRNGVDAIGEVPSDRWDLDAYFDPDPDAPGKMSTRWGGFLDHIYDFDAAFFGISPREALFMDPQQRLLLEVTWEALEDAGQAPDRLAGSRTGVYVGICRNDYSQVTTLSGDLRRFGLYHASGQAHSIAAGRISYVLGLQGPCIAVDTACSSSLVAAHLAARSLRSGECDLAIVAGANAVLSPEYTITFSKARMMAADGRCKTFDASADGYVGGDGCGVVILKRLSDALKARDRVLAVIRGTAINQDGASSGLTAPNGPAQQAVIRAALADGRVDPSQVSYIEAHGTGTSLGDPIEVQALAAVLAVGRSQDRPLALGSVKTNFGHLEGAAGVAGLIKLVLSLRHGEIPPHLHLKEPSPHIPWNTLAVTVPTRTIPWVPEGGSRIGGLSSFGFSGTNAHLVVEEAPAPAPLAPAPVERPQHLLVLSAKTASALQALAGRYAAHLAAHPEQAWPDVCHTATVSRAHFPHRLALMPETGAGAALATFATGTVAPGVRTGPAVGPTRPKVAFLFTGQGAQYGGMGRELYQTQPTFRQTLDRCAEILRPHLAEPLLAVMFGEGADPARLDATGYTQPALFALEYALATLWRSWGVEPTWVLGHSVGEVVAACVAGVLTLEDGLALIATRARLMQALPPDGAMVAVMAPEARVQEAIGPFAREVSMAAVNGPASVVISGRRATVEQVRQALERTGIKTKSLTVSHAFHSPCMEPMLADFERVAAGLTYAPPRLGLISNLTGQSLPAGAIDAAYWRRHVREPVQFQAGMAALQAQGVTLFLEVGPHPILLGLGQQCLPDGAGTWLPTLRKGRPAWETVLATLGELYVRGVPIDWGGVDRDYPRRKVSLPTYPFERREYRVAPKALPTEIAHAKAGDHPLLGRRVFSPLVKETFFDGKLGPQVLPYLQDHQVYGHVVIPAAAYVEMAWAGAVDLFDSPVLEDIVIQEALIVPTDGARDVQLVLSPEDDGRASFRLISLAGEQAADREFRVHVSGTARWATDTTVASQPVDLEYVRERCSEALDVPSYYEWIHGCGLEMGSRFQGIEQLWRCEGESLARIRIPEGLEAEQDAYGIHPTLLDAGFSIVAAALPRVDGKTGDAYMPLGLDAYRLYGRAGSRLFSHCVVRAGDEMGRETLAADIRLLDDAGSVVAEVQGIRLKRVDRATLGRAVRDVSDDWLYRVEWRPKPRPAVPEALPEPMPSTLTISEIAERAESQTALLAAEHGLATYDVFLPRLDVLCAAYAAAAFRHLGWSPSVGERVSLNALAERLGVKAQHRRLLGRLLEFFSEDGVLEPVDGEWEVRTEFPLTDSRKMWKEMVQAFPTGAAELELTGRCGEDLAAVLRGESDPLALLFPGGSLQLAERLYREAPSSRVVQSLARDTVVAAVGALSARRAVRLLEIGAGTGGTTTYVVPALPAERVEYCFTDISPLFVNRAKESFAGYPFMRFEVLDIEQDPLRQGFPAQGYDVVVAANVLHATRDLRETLRNVGKLVAPGGLFVLVEVATRQRWIDLTFGLLDGWWRFADTGLRPSYPLLSHDRWIALLGELGFDSCVKIPRAAEGRILSEHGVVLARAPREAAAPAAGRWLLLADRGGIGARLAEMLEARGGSCFVVKSDAMPFEDLRQRVREAVVPGQSLRGVIHLWSLDETPSLDASGVDIQAAIHHGTGSALELVKALRQADVGEAPRLWLVTNGVQSARPAVRVAAAQAPAWGLARVVALEHPELTCTCIDLDPTATAETSAECLLDEVVSPETEDQVAFRDGARRVARLVRATLPRPVLRTPQHLLAGRSGVLEDLRLVPLTRRPPGPNEIEIEVHATGLNFRDVLNALGMRADDQSLGGECAGRIVSVGAGVTGLQKGDAVVAVCAGCFSSFVTTTSELVLPKPSGVSFEEAAGIPIAFLTAKHALFEVGGLKAGERVLIHAAAGGVGLAAVQLARRAGAEIFATAGSSAKREFLQMLGVQHVMDSRSLNFAGEILAATDGRGVEIVLNSLTGEFIPKNLSILSPGGRFVEIGKADLWEPARVAALRADVSYTAIDLAATLRDHPASLRPLLGPVLEDVARRELQPLPRKVFRLSEVTEAFRFMAQARHIGKVVVSHSVDNGRGVRPDATYLITGGLAGLGLLVARWLVERGARHLVLMGRRAPAEAGRTAIRELEAQGATVVVAQGDVAQEARVQEILAGIAAAAPPLRGIIHAAGVLDDGVLLQQTWERFARVMAPKVLGAWHLHRATEELELDFFVLFSSAAALLGSPGQANHAAANAFLDALAHHRRALGLPAVSINWGVWSGSGVAAERGVGARAAVQGIGSFNPEEGLHVLGRVMAADPVQIGVVSAQWSKLLKASRTGSAFVAEIAGRAGGGVAQEAMKASEPVSTGIRSELERAAPAERQRRLVAFVRERTAKVLALDPTEEVDVQKPLNELGLDSLMAVELRNALGSGLGLTKTLPATLVFDHPTIADLSDYLGRSALGLDLGKPIPDSKIGETAGGGLLDRIEQLSEDEVELIFGSGASESGQ